MIFCSGKALYPLRHQNIRWQLGNCWTVTPFEKNKLVTVLFCGIYIKYFSTL